MSDEKDSQQLKLRGNGDLTIVQDGAKVTVAHYDKATGRLEFTTKKHSVDYYNQATSAIGTTGDGKDVSGNVIRSIGYKGDGYDPAAKKPKRPKMGPEGDSAEDIVQYYIEHDLPQAIVRYGIYTDAKGEPIRKKVRRVIKNIVDQRNLDEDQLEAVKEGNKSASKSPVSVMGDIIEDSRGIIARRATRLTYTPNEVVGGWVPDEDDDNAQGGGEGDE